MTNTIPSRHPTPSPTFAIVRAALLAASVASIVVAAPSARAQSFPAKPVRIVVPNPSGGGVDLLARILGGRLSETWGQQVLVENRPGGSTLIATEYTLKQPADGHTLLIVANSFLINAATRPNLAFDPVKDFTAVTQLVMSPLVFLVNAASPAKTLADLLDLARARPGQLSFASVGPASTHHIAGETLKSMAKVNMLYAPYTGGAPAVNALLGGHVDSVIAAYAEVARYVEAGKLRPLAVLTAQRIEPWKDVPTVAESGFRGFEATPWYGIVVRSGAPAETVRKLSADVAAAVRHPDVREKLVAQGFYPVGNDADTFAAHLRAQLDRLRVTVKEAGITAN